MGHGGSQTAVVDCQEKNILARLKARYNDLEAKPSYSGLDSGGRGREGVAFVRAVGTQAKISASFSHR